MAVGTVGQKKSQRKRSAAVRKAVTMYQCLLREIRAYVMWSVTVIPMLRRRSKTMRQ